ncbi:TPA: Arc family DNA-binding protein [Pseudomonas aeruginosa]|nr:Arc family DNA-binding protein [Pseudomonas aeruginosa]
MSRSDPQFNLRIPEELKELVVAAARENKRSATAEILARLERSFTEPNDLGWTDIERLRDEELGNPTQKPNSTRPTPHPSRKIELVTDSAKVSDVVIDGDRIVIQITEALANALKGRERSEQAEPSQPSRSGKRSPKK